MGASTPSISIDGSVDPDLAAIRSFTASTFLWMIECGIHDHTAKEIEIAMTEAMNNIANHSVTDTQSHPIHVTVILFKQFIQIELIDFSSNSGLHFYSPPTELPLDCLESGRGIFLLKALVDSVEYFQGIGKNILRIRKSVHSSFPGDNHSRHSIFFNDPQASDQEGLSLVLDEMESTNEMLAVIFDTIKIIGNQNKSKEETADLILSRLKDILKLEWFLFFELDNASSQFHILSQSCQFEASEIFEKSFSLLLKQILIHSVGNPWQEIVHGDFAFDVIHGYLPGPFQNAFINPVLVDRRLVGVLAFGYNKFIEEIPSPQRQLIRTFSEFLGIQLFAHMFKDYQLRDSILKQELEIARNIQQCLLPGRLPIDNYSEIAVLSETAQKVGGDLFDIEHIDEGEFLICIMDVMGKGIPAALFATICRTVLRTNFKYFSDPALILKETNKQIWNDLSSVEMFITAQIIYVNVRTGKIVLANAGHPPMLMKSGSSPHVEEITAEGLPLGISDDADYENTTHILPPDFSLFIYTDGITDTIAENGSDYLGIAGLKNWISQYDNSTVSVNKTIKDLKLFLDQLQTSKAFNDDQTMIIVGERSAFSI